MTPRKPAQSAQGLFAATGHRRKDVVVRDLVSGELVKSKDGLARHEDDFQPTPPEPTLALLHAEREKIDLWTKGRYKAVWEPAAGNGAMVRVIEAAGYRVIAGDIRNRGMPGVELMDFFAYATRRSDCIITNPPFNRVNWRDGQGEWISHALGTLEVPYMALLLPWNWPGAAGLKSIWHEFPPQRVYLMRWKIDFSGQGSPPMLNAWFVWDWSSKGIARAPELLMLDRADVLQGELSL